MQTVLRLFTVHRKLVQYVQIRVYNRTIGRGIACRGGTGGTCPQALGGGILGEHRHPKPAKCFDTFCLGEGEAVIKDYTVV